jgi:hypothetical protein
MIEDKIRQIVAEHYQPGQTRPFLLSHIGARLAKDGDWPLPTDDRRTLRDVVEAIPDLSLIVDEQTPSFIAVVPVAEEKLAHNAIAKRRKLFFLRGLPRAVLLAFTTEIAEETPVYLLLGERITFVVGLAARPEGGIEIDANLRMPGLPIDQLNELDDALIEKLDGKIREWCARHEIAPAQLTRKRAPVPLPSIAISKGQSALERLVQAQDPQIARRLIVPIDIALLLSRMP